MTHSHDFAQPVAKLLYVTTLGITQWKFLEGQNAFMRRNGFELHAICSPDRFCDALAERDGVRLYPVPISREIDPLGDARALLAIYRHLRAIRPDIVHVSTPKAALLGAIAARAAGVPVRLFFVRGLATEGAVGRTRGVFHALERLTSSLCDEVVCVSPSLLAWGRAEGIIPPGKGRVAGHGMSNGIDTDRFAPAPYDRSAAEGEVTIGLVGRLSVDKGVEDLAAAWTRLRDRFPSARLLLVGPWEERDAVSSDCRSRLEGDPRVEVTGYVEDVQPLYQRMDVFAFPSHGTEGFPNAPMEAAASGVPVVATRVVGCTDAVEDGVTGALVPPRDTDALTEALRRYLADPALRRRHGAAGRDRVERCYRRDRVWAGMLAIYRDLLERAGLPAPRPAEPAPVGSR